MNAVAAVLTTYINTTLILNKTKPIDLKNQLRLIFKHLFSIITRNYLYNSLVQKNNKG